MTQTYNHFINGDHVEDSSGCFSPLFNPFIAEHSAQAAQASEAQVINAVAATSEDTHVHNSVMQ